MSATAPTPGPAPVIAIDGPSASGKGTLARRLAAHFGFAHLDTGKLYRAVGLAVLRADGDPADAKIATAAARAIDLSTIDDPALTADDVAQAASKVAAIPEVRAALVAAQRNFAAHPPGAAGAVLDGRDIGTAICPDAEVKLFVVASPEARARRRQQELRARGHDAIYADVLQDMKQRDARDSMRSTAPSRAADDAVKLDTTAMDADAAFRAALDMVVARLRRQGMRGAASG